MLCTPPLPQQGRSFMSPILNWALLGKVPPAHRAAIPELPDLETLGAVLALTLDHREANYISRASIPFAFSR